MLNQWQQVEDWLNNNKISHWIFTANNRSNRPKESGGDPNDKIVDSAYLPEDRNDKMAITKQMLEQYGMRAYGIGWHDKKSTDGLCVEVQLNGGYGMMPMASVSGPAAPAVDAEALRKQIMNEIKLQQFEEEKKAFEEEKKEFQKEKEGVLGLAIGYLRPVLGALAGKRVAGIDAPGAVTAEPVAPLNNAPAPVEQPSEEAVFTDEEEDRLYNLMMRFKKVEPQFIELIENVVKMAEAGDSTYTMARGFLLKD